jgi:hypothetical protein
MVTGMTELVLLVAKGLAEYLAKPLGERLRDRILGTPDERALEAVCRKAVERAMQEAEREGVSATAVAESLDLFTRLLRQMPAEELPVLAPPPDEMATVVQRWRVAAGALGFDPDTMPASFDLVVGGLLVALPDEFADAGERHGSPLFGRVVLANMDRLQTGLAGLAGASVSALRLSTDVEEALGACYAACRATDRAFLRADLLLVLLKIPGGAATACFDKLGTGQAAAIRQQLSRYLAGLDPSSAGAFSSFDWSLQPEIARGRRIAANAGLPVVTDACVLLALLEGSSGTAAELRERLGPRFSRLRAAAAGALKRPDTVATPRGVLGDWGKPDAD